MAKRKSNKGAGALKAITTKAKAIYRKGGTWKTAIKKAAQLYRGGKRKIGAYKVIERGETKSTPARKTYRMHRNKKGNFRGMQSVGLIPGTAKMNVVNGIGGQLRAVVNGIGSIQSMKAHIRENVKERLAKQLLHRDMETTKRGKRKITKRITALRSELKKYC